MQGAEPTPAVGVCSGPVPAGSTSLDDVPYVNLPAIHSELVGNWPVTAHERVVAARIVSTLPPAPPPEADVVTRWNTVVGTVGAAVDGMRDAPELRVGREGRAIPQGQVDMLIMPHILAQALTMRQRYVDWLHEMPERGKTIMAKELDSLEPEVERFRRLLIQIAAGE